MKLKDIIYIFFRPNVRFYSHEVKRIKLKDLEEFSFAYWKHPCFDVNFESWDIDSLKGILNKGDLVIDIGAHAGDTSIIPALIVGKEGLVISIEPNPFVFKVLQKNALLNIEKVNILPIMCAITENGEDLVFEYSDPGFCNGGFHKNVPLWKHGHMFKLEIIGARLHDILRYPFIEERLPKLKLVKVDAEGYDLFILKDMEDIIHSRKPHILVEVYKHASQGYREELFMFLKKHGYTLYIADEFRNLKMAQVQSPDELIRRKGTFDLFCEPYT